MGINGRCDIISNVPIDIMIEIFSYVSFKDCARSEAVCKEWQKRSSHDAIWKRFATLSNVDHPEGKDIKKCVVEHFVTFYKDAICVTDEPSLEQKIVGFVKGINKTKNLAFEYRPQSNLKAFLYHFINLSGGSTEMECREAFINSPFRLKMIGSDAADFAKAGSHTEPLAETPSCNEINYTERPGFLGSSVGARPACKVTNVRLNIQSDFYLKVFHLIGDTRVNFSQV